MGYAHVLVLVYRFELCIMLFMLAPALLRRILPSKYIDYAFDSWIAEINFLAARSTIFSKSL